MNVKLRLIEHKGRKVEAPKATEKGDWIDLRAAEDIVLDKGDRTIIPLGVAMELPEGYEGHVLPRSSTCKKFNVIQGNSQGIIDNSYCGDNDEWGLPVIAVDHCVIHFNDRICQFRIVEKQPHIVFDIVDHLDNEDRGGFGSTGVQ